MCVSLKALICNPVAIVNCVFRSVLRTENKIQRHKRKTGEVSVGNRQKKKPPAMEAEFLQPKRISRPSFKLEEPFHISFYFWCLTKKKTVPQNVPNLLHFTIMQNSHMA